MEKSQSKTANMTQVQQQWCASDATRTSCRGRCLDSRSSWLVREQFRCRHSQTCSMPEEYHSRSTHTRLSVKTWFSNDNRGFSQLRASFIGRTLLRYVCLMAWAASHLSVTLLLPTLRVERFGNIFAPLIALRLGQYALKLLGNIPRDSRWQCKLLR